ncbi:MAG: rhamnogalacturonan acetylesterase [Chitinophagales bacterium]|nr:rhamnogalacturonan acetylesterase [Chitinophagales bacterium]
MKNIFITLITITGLSFMIPEKNNIHIFLAGDSTMSIKEPRYYPETGWGMPFVYFWDSTVTVINKAKNGRSTSSFRNEGSWKQIMDECKEGDFVFIQFGHNDEIATKKTYTTETEFKTNLLRYVTEARDKKTTPLLLTPVARRKFNAAGQIEGTHDVYAQLVRDVAKETGTLLIDLDKKSQALYQELGVEHSRLLFVQLKPGEHPHYPEGKEDNTHFSELGARMIAQLVLKDLKTLHTALNDRLFTLPPKK